MSRWGQPAPVRWRDDTGWEYRCDECAARGVACFWPLTHEFWDPQEGMRRCRACQKARQARWVKERRRRDPVFAERQRERSRKYRVRSRKALSVKWRARWEAMKADPVEHERIRELQRERQRRFRARKKAA